MSGRVSKRALNRALLARQMLLQRSTRSPLETIEHLVGMQAQAPNPPYYALHARLENFTHDALSQLIRDRLAVRIALMRSTIHLVSARDCLAFRAVLEPMLKQGAKGMYQGALNGMDLDALRDATRALVIEQPRTFSDLGMKLAETWPGRDRQSMTFAARALVPLVQVPPRGLWNEGGAAAIHTCAFAWLGQSVPDRDALSEMILRYLKAFGPASVMDVQAWCGLKRLRDTIDGMRSQLRTSVDEDGVELFDIPDAPMPDADTTAPVRFLGEFDNMLISYADRTRIVSDVYRARIYTANGIVRATILVDGFVAGEWRIVQDDKRATLQIEAFRKLSAADRDALGDEGQRLLSFAAPEAHKRDVRFVRAIDRS